MIQLGILRAMSRVSKHFKGADGRSEIISSLEGAARLFGTKRCSWTLECVNLE